MKKLFTVAIGEAEGVYFANVNSLTDGKNATCESSSMKILLVKMNKLIRVKAKQERLIPMPTKGRIIALNGDHVSEPVPTRS